ncbi:MAG: outer membrane beta-barrel protein [Sporocytophaga sp.]|uniref:outer membrane beta-barrel protein n=1 Tax=Sporocytophaga sp. TaxID=2231183 RepID=UPI001B18575D|nr:outer membrane beta-barrel protein [Sporocytophaga sp.]MBO9701460.1 outer membrane beta-barrel protein [Sporocytophaga sp.]
MRKYILPVLMAIVLISAQNTCNAQDNIKTLFSYNYGMGFATGDLKSYIDKKLFDGFSVEGRFFINKNISLGLNVGYNDFRKYLNREVYSTGSGNISAVQTRYFNTVPVLATGFYYLNSISAFKPYAGIGIGAYVSNYQKYYSTLESKHTKTCFGFRPEIGTLIKLRNGLGLIVSGRYNYATYSYQEFSSLNYFELNFGLSFSIEK